MGTKLLWLHEAEAFGVKASALWFQKLKASASWIGKGFGFSFGFATSQIQNFTFGFIVSKLIKLNILNFQIMLACIICLNLNKYKE